MMKLFTRIFAFYMIALALVPCGDNGNGIVDITRHLLGIEHETHADHEQHSKACGDDDCTPFCICSCCSMVLDFPVKQALGIKSPDPILTIMPVYFSDAVFSSFITFVWQPPNIS